MEGLDVLDVLAVMFGVFFNIRKLDAVRRTRDEFPHVSERDFATWQARERSVYGIGSWACFLKVPLDLGFSTLVMPKISYTLARPIGAAIDLVWLAMVILTFVRTIGLGRRRRELGIILGGYVADPSRPRTAEDGPEDDEDAEDEDER